MINISRFTTKYGTFTLPQNDRFIAESFAKGGHWEENVIDILIKVVDKEDTVINVGSHVGSTSIPLAPFVKRIFCFEPQTILYKLLLENICTNGAYNIVPIKGVVSNSKNKTITIKSTDHEGRSIRGGNNDKVNYGGVSIGKGGEEVHSYKIDNLRVGNIKLITIDAEGAEETVFLSALNTIEEQRPILMIEQNYLTLTEDMIDVLQTNERINIKQFLYSIKYYEPIDLGDCNLLYIPKVLNNFLLNMNFSDMYGDIWTFSEEGLLSSTGSYKYYYISDNSILVQFNRIERGRFDGKIISWTNNTRWEMI